MPFEFSKGLRYYTFELFRRQELSHGVFTRQGGVSPDPWASLNLGGTNGDLRENVIENRRRIFSALEKPVDTIFDSWQVHGTQVICVEKPRQLDEAHQKADAILTDQRDITLFMRFADCVPIFLYDPTRQVIGLVHAGWRGTIAGVAGVAVQRMAGEYQSKPANILAAIGPSICVHHYQVGEEVVKAAQEAFGKDSARVLHENHGSLHFDLWQANKMILARSGVTLIEIAGLCTACHNEDWYSHRKEHGKTGRFGALLALK